MKRLQLLILLISMGLFPAARDQHTWAAEEGVELPPVAQAVIREGDFAVRLAEVLGVGSAQSEVEAESDLAAKGIAPPNGWIADYPVTPDTVEALYQAVGEAAEAGKLSMRREEALKRYVEMTASLGLAVRSYQAGTHAGEAPPADYGTYADPSVISNYYYDRGPPLVTYYTPPWDYSYVYRFVPYPFWWGQTFFGGFFILNDFHTFRKVVVKKHGHKFVNHKRVTNHFFDRKRNKFGRVDPLHRLNRHKFGGFHHDSHGRGFQSHDARRGAESIFKHHSGRTGSFGNHEFGGRKGFSHGFRHDRFQSQGTKHRFDSIGRTHHRSRAFGQNERGRSFRESGVHRGTDRKFENRSGRSERNGFGSFGRRSGNFDKSFKNLPSERGWRKFSGGGRDGGRSFSRGGGSNGRGGFSGSRGPGRGGGGGCRGRC